MSIQSCSIVGTGTAARAIGVALSSADVRILSVAGRDEARAQQLASMLSSSAHHIGDVDLSADLLLICVSDSAVAEVCGEVFQGRESTNVIVAHTAGPMGLEALASARAAGARRGKLHPIASLSGGATRLHGAAWGIEGDTPETTSELSALVESMGGLPLDIADVDLPMYHLAAVFCSNYLLALADVATNLWQISGAPMPAAEALMPLISGTLENWVDLGLENALTGSISRGDSQAVQRQLQALIADAPEYEPLFRMLGVVAVGIAQRRFGPSDAALGEIARLLGKNTMID